MGEAWQRVMRLFPAPGVELTAIAAALTDTISYWSRKRHHFRLSIEKERRPASPSWFIILRLPPLNPLCSWGT